MLNAMHRVVIVAPDDVVPFDLAIPTDTFSHVSLRGGRSGYRVRVCGVRKEVEAGSFRVRLRYGLSELAHADTIVLAGVMNVNAAVPAALVHAVRKAAARGTRVA
jgi:transcriptional regulator GlxA family with amidase domain